VLKGVKSGYGGCITTKRRVTLSTVQHLFCSADTLATLTAYCQFTVEISQTGRTLVSTGFDLLFGDALADADVHA
jgi:hypothetical protein